TTFDDNVQSSVEWRRTLSTTGYTQFQVSRYFYAQRKDVMGKNWAEYVEPEPNDLSADPFYDTGDDNSWQDTRMTTWALEGSAVQRLFKRHEIEFGIEHQFQDVQYLTIQDPWVEDPDG